MDATAAPPITQPIPVVVEKPKKNLTAIIVVVLIVFLIIIIIYYVYNHFAEKKTESFVEGQRQERDDPQSDFDLHTSIKRLEQMQSNILKNVTAVYS